MFLLLLPVAVVIFGVCGDLFLKFVAHLNDDRGMPCVIGMAIPFAMFGGLQAGVEAICKPAGYKALASGLAANFLLVIVLMAALALIVR